MADAVEIQGHCAPRFAAVRAAFASNFDAGAEHGASFAAVRDGELVVDLWAGFADPAHTRPWERDTIVNVFSTTKAMAALCTLMLVDRGRVELDAPVARYWPEFAAGGKADLPVRYLLSHTSGLAGWHEPIPVETLYDWERSTALLAAQEPWWKPGERSGYHALTHGHLLGEVVRRVAGKTLGRFFRDEVATPLGVDFHIGTDPALEPRIAELDPPVDAPGAAAPAGSIAARVLGNPAFTAADANTRPWRSAEIPAANGHGNARSVARVAGVLARGGTQDGVRLLSPATLAQTIEVQSDGEDLVLGLPVRFGLGFGLTSPTLPIGPNPRTFFWGGYGGSLVVIDPDAKLGFSYVMNRMAGGTMGDTRAFGPLMALYQSLS